MKRKLIKTIALVLSLAMILAMLGGCGSQNQAPSEEAAVAAALDTVNEAKSVTIAADGRQITIEDAQGQTVQQLLELAGITMKEGDVLTLALDQVPSEHFTIQLLRRNTVTVVLAGEEPQQELRCTVVMAGGNVSDALAAAGIQLAADQITNYKLDDALEDNMQILVTTEKAPEETEATEPEDTEDDSSDDDYYDDDYSNSYEPAPTEPAPTAPAPTEPAPTEPAPTEPAPTEPERTVVSVEVYEDCDGSGHGVKIITYSDGTQEEVYF